ncbi:protein Hook homolog 3 isoform X2 [Cimex lectularius]|uniref:Protein hook n=2 Tax=Cimex lectularius TaxID=79782 RepID=A0A8I6S5B7_CIMLE|nr:protein Hook homolog 3 isoform X2 [Cimex lectularius]
MDKKQLCEILFKWLQSFSVEKKFGTIKDLNDGVVIAQVLNQIAPEWFPPVWLSKIKTDANDNWRLNVSNLKKVLSKILDYYQECFGQNLNPSVLPDVVKIGDGCDPQELGRLLQLVLGCAVNCDNKQEYIGQIMKMDEIEQRVMMECIQELDSGGALSFSANFSLDPQLEQLVAQLNAANLAKEKAELKANELDLQIATLQEEKLQLIEEKKNLLDELHSRYELTGSGPLRRQVESLKEEIFKLETQRDDYRLKLEHQDKEMLELQAIVDDLQRSAQEARSLKDELDILRETADRVEKYEAAIESYKKKLEEAGDMKRELKQIEAKLKEYMLMNMELEEELKKVSGLKAQVEVFKKETTELHDRLSDETKRADKLQYEVGVLSSKLMTTVGEKERLIKERDALKEANEELSCAKVHAQSPVGGNKDIGLESVGVLESSSDLRQKIARLEHENQMLKMSQKGKEEDSVQVLQNHLETSRALCDKMWKENRQAHQKIAKLEGELREASEKDGFQTKIMELQQQLFQQRHKYSAELDEKDAALVESKDVISILQEKLSQKEAELQESEARSKKYCEKARSAIKAIDPDIDTNSTEASLRSQIVEIHRSYKEKEKEMEEMKKIFEMEGKMISTTFHRLSQKKQREAIEQRLASLGHGQSFINSQRQPFNARANAP